MKGKFLSILVFISVISRIAFAQIDYGQEDPRVPLYKQDPYGNTQYERQGIMVGNRIYTLYFNYGEVGYWQFATSMEWPSGSGRERWTDAGFQGSRNGGRRVQAHRRRPDPR